MNLDEMARDAAKPRYMREELRAMLGTLQMMDRLCAGPNTMWSHATEYIRKWPDEDPEVYRIRRTCEPIFMGLNRTITAGVGMLWGKEPLTIWNASASLTKPLADNIDAEGTKLSVFAKQYTELVLRHGLALLLVDHTASPKDPSGRPIVITSANEARYNLRPLWKMYSRLDVLNWSETVINNVKTLTMITLAESLTEQEGEYGVASVQLFRVLRLQPIEGVLTATWTLLRERESSDGVISYEKVSSGIFRNQQGLPASFLPISVAYAGRKVGAFTCDVPLEGTAHANIGHWEYATDLKFNRRVAGFEQMIISGELQRDPTQPDDAVPTVKFGPLVVIHLMQGGSVVWSGPSGSGLAQLEQGQREKLEQMDQMGLGFLVQQNTVQQTATEKAINSYAQLSTLSTAGIAIADAVNLAWEHTGWYYGVEKADCPVMTINTNFVDGKLGADSVNAYVTLVKAGFPKMLVLTALKDGGWIAEDADLDTLLLDWEGDLAAEREVMVAAAEAMRAPEEEEVTL